MACVHFQILPATYRAAGVFQSVSGLPRQFSVNKLRLIRTVTSRLRSLFNDERIKVEVSPVSPEGMTAGLYLSLPQ
jgi:hypothetical protein